MTPEVELVPVEEDVLARLVAAAISDAAPDDVTPPVPDGGWGSERIQWLRRFHRDRRAGLEGPLGEATWAVCLDGSVVGAVRLKRTAEAGVLETGIWLTRSARHQDVGRRALMAVLERAAAAGAADVSADTTAGNVAALALLRRLGFRVGPPSPDGRAPARRRLSGGPVSQTREASDPTAG